MKMIKAFLLAATAMSAVVYNMRRSPEFSDAEFKDLQYRERLKKKYAEMKAQQQIEVMEIVRRVEARAEALRKKMLNKGQDDGK